MSVFVTLAIAILTPGPTTVQKTDLSQTAVYACSLDRPDYPDQIMRIEVAVDAAPGQPDRVSLRFCSEESAFAFVAVGAEAIRLLSRPRRIRLDRYILQTSGGHVLEFHRRETGRPFLPYSFELQPDPLLPVCFDEHGEFRPEFDFLGESYSMVEHADSEEEVEVPEARVVRLSDDLLVGTSRNSREVDGRRIPMREFAGDWNLDYTYRPFDEADMQRMLGAGFNYFDRVLPDQLAFLMDKPVFFDLETFHSPTRPIFPEVFFHPGFLGVEDFLDEPAYIYWEDWKGPVLPDEKITLAQMAQKQEARTLSEFNRTSRGRMTGLTVRLAHSGIALDEVDLIEPQFPIWEEFYSTGCYQLRIPVSGFIHEGRYNHPETVKLLNDTFRINLPRRPESMFRFYYAFLRGAARVFDKDWGMSIYGQADPEVSLLAMTMAYDRGARYIWFWSSDRDHHLPFEEQIELAAGLSEYVKEYPRGDRRALVREAQDAIVLPYGFTFSVSDWQKRRMADLWHRKAFPIEGGVMEDGTYYYSVLRLAAEKMEELVDAGREFDMVIDVPELAAAGYTRRHRVLPEARSLNYEYPRWIHYKLQIALCALVLFWSVYRMYRIVRWISRRRAKLASCPTEPG